MNRIVISLLVALLAPTRAFADAPPPTPAQLEQAKKAFAEGKRLHEAGKPGEAVVKFKESYRLSRNPLLLYNIGFTFDETKEEDMALFYYRKFLHDAPADAAQRATVTERVKALESQVDPDARRTEPTSATEPVHPPKPADPAIKPPGTYRASDFQHQVIETAPPGKPLDITAFVPEDSGFVVTLHFRTAGESRFTAKRMKWRYKELVGRVPAAKMTGNAVQYYIEVKDTAGATVTRAAKSTSPNVVHLEAGASPRFYPDLIDDGDAKLSDDVKDRDDVDDPLGEQSPRPAGKPGRDDVGPPPARGTSMRDVGSTRFNYAKWGTTAGAGAMLGLSVVCYLQATKYARALEDDAQSCGAPPCLAFDDYGAGVQATGQRYQILTNVALGVGIATLAVASYFWVKQLTTRQRGEQRRAALPRPTATTASWVLGPTLDGGFAGAAAAARF